ncbi:MAG: hypothetical protein CEO22_3 [Candidatus Berkelbacteria bacterium Gr01-1014_85]|uniref:Uncharacterized protein n=1 Tax=Candidatus Berkelbacteria bacterium Gr01-1014_85 TaxID=2017150 RepID=A0A554JDX5_9BACT|nr:MAG: hypothetical protein CEO22_3 [Candidatus Berkelbacteria bacterium Gr01-1014_85]
MRKQLIALGLILIITFIGFMIDSRGGASADELEPNIAIMGLRDLVNTEGTVTVYGANSGLKIFGDDTPNNEYRFVPLAVAENKLETTVYAHLSYPQCIGYKSYCENPFNKFEFPKLKVIQTKTVALNQIDPDVAELVNIPPAYTSQALTKLEQHYGVVINPDRRARISKTSPDFFGSTDTPLLTKGYLARDKSLNRLVFVVTDLTTDHNIQDTQKSIALPSKLAVKVPEHSNSGYLKKIDNQYYIESTLDPTIKYRIANSIYGDNLQRLPSTLRESLDVRVGKQVFPGPHLIAGFGEEKVILTDSPEIPILPQASYPWHLYESILATSDLKYTFDEMGIVYRPAYSLSTTNALNNLDLHFNDVIYSDSFYYDNAKKTLVVKDNVTDATYSFETTQLNILSTIEDFYTHQTMATQLKNGGTGWNTLTNRDSIQAKLTNSDDCFSKEYNARSTNIDCIARIYTSNRNVTMITVHKLHKSNISISEVGRLSESDMNKLLKCENDLAQQPIAQVSLKPGQRPTALNLTIAPEYTDYVKFRVSEPEILSTYFSFERFRTNVLAKKSGYFNYIYSPTIALEGDGWARYLDYTCPNKNTFTTGIVNLPPVDELKSIGRVLTFDIKPKYELYRYEPAEKTPMDTTIKAGEAINIEPPCSAIKFDIRSETTLKDSLDHTNLAYDTNVYLRITNDSNKDSSNWQFKLYDTPDGQKEPSETRPVRQINDAPLLVDRNLTQLRELKDIAYTTDQGVLIGHIPAIAAKSSRELNLGAFKLNINYEDLPVGIIINQEDANYARCKYFDSFRPYSIEKRLDRLTKPNNGLSSISNCNVTVEPKITLEFNPITRSKVYYNQGYDASADNRTLSLKITNTDTVPHDGYAIMVADPKVMSLRPIDYKKDTRRYTIPAQSSVVVDLGIYEFKFLENVRLDLDERNAPAKANALRDFYILHSISGTCGQLFTFVDTTIPFHLTPEPTPTATPVPTVVPTPTTIATSTPTPVVPTSIPTPTATATPKPIATATPVPTTTATAIPKPTTTPTPAPTSTATPTATTTASIRPTNTSSPRPTSTSTSKPRPSNTPKPATSPISVQQIIRNIINAIFGRR